MSHATNMVGKLDLKSLQRSSHLLQRIVKDALIFSDEPTLDRAFSKSNFNLVKCNLKTVFLIQAGQMFEHLLECLTNLISKFPLAGERDNRVTESFCKGIGPLVVALLNKSY